MKIVDNFDQFNRDRSMESFTNAFVKLTELAAIATSWSSLFMRHLHKPSSMLKPINDGRDQYELVKININNFDQKF